MKLTNKQELFIQYYMISLNATDSYMKVYKCKNDNVAGVEGFKLLRNPKIRTEIDLRLDKRATDNGITADYVLKGIKAIADREGIRENDTLKAYELLGKHLKLFTEKIESTVDATVEAKVDLTGFTTDQLKEMLKE